MSDPYCYDNGTLRNRLGITDPDALAGIEAAVTTQRITELEINGLPGRFDLDHLCAIHRRIFGDLYEWAGEMRMVDLAKDDTVFCLARFLVPAAHGVFAAVPQIRLEMTRGQQLVPASVAVLYGDLNALHPFREGNGRAQRAFIGLLCGTAGVALDWSAITPSGNIAASVAATHGDNTGLHAALRIAAGQPTEPDQAHWNVVLQP